MTIDQNATPKTRLFTRPSVFLTLLICVMLTACGDDICGTEIPNTAPDKPSNPSPPDSGSASIDTHLDWECSDPEKDPLTYDVYFGTEATPLIEAENESKSIYKPDSLEYETRYNWQIVAKDSEGNTTTGPLWTFTTVPQGDLPPYPPSIVSPAEYAIDVAVTDSLAWNSSDPNLDPLTHDVILDILTPPADTVAHDISATSYDPPGDLEYGTRYYWQVVVKDTTGYETPGDIWTFTTVDNQAPNIVNGEPGNGVNGLNPLTIDIVWEATDLEGDEMWFDVLLDTVYPPTRIVAESITENRFRPTGLFYNKKYYWRIRAKDQYGARDGEEIWNFTTRGVVELPVVASLDTGRSVDVAVGWPGVDCSWVYVASRDMGLVKVQVLDDYDPPLLVIWRNYDPGDGRGVGVDGAYRYLGAGDYGLHCVIAGDPSTYDLVDSLDTPGKASRMAIVGNYLYLADRLGGLRIVDISDTDTLTAVGHYPSAPSEIPDVAVAGDYAYVLSIGRGLEVINITDPSDPFLVGRSSYIGAPYGEVAVSGAYAYVAAYDLYVIDISTPSSPTRVKLFQTDGDVGSVAIDGNYAYVGIRWGIGLVEVIDISDPKNPKRAGHVPAPNEAYNTHGVAFDEKFIYIACETSSQGLFQVVKKSLLD